MYGLAVLTSTYQCIDQEEILGASRSFMHIHLASSWTCVWAFLLENRHCQGIDLQI
jgi:hypothetical protein